MTRRGMWKLLIEVAVVLLVIAAVGAWQRHGLVEGEAPALSGIGVHGETIDLSHYRGRPVLVYFWATWCPVCKLEQGTVNALLEDHAVITVAMQSGDAAAIRTYLDEHTLAFPALADEDGQLAARYGVKGVPTSFIVDGEGRIRFREVGYTSGWGLRARLWLAGD